MRQELTEKKSFFGNRPTVSKKEWVVVRYSLLYLFLFLWFWPGLVAAQQDNPAADAPISEGSHAVRLSLRDALYYSLQGNQDIQISAFTPKQAKEDLVAAQSVYDPSFFLSASHDRTLDPESDLLDPTVDEETNLKLGIKKLLGTGGTVSLFLKTLRVDKIDVPFDFDSRYLTAPAFELKQPLLKNFGAKEQKATITIQNSNVNISEAEFHQTVNDTLAQVSRIYWRLFMHREIVGINRDTLEMAQEVHRREVVRLDEGISKPLDVARAQSAAEARRTEVLRSQERVRVVTDQLKFLLNWSNLNIDSDNLIVPVESPQTNPITVDKAVAIKNGLENRPEINKAKKNQDIAMVHEDLARHQRLPKLDAVMNYGINGYDGRLSDAFGDVAFDDENDWSVGLEFEMPIGNRLAKATHRKQMLMREQAGVAVKRVANQIKFEIKQAIHAIDLAEGEIQSTFMEKTAAEIVVAGEIERFELGQMTNEELLRAQDFLANARRNYVQAIVNYNIALSELNRAQSKLPNGLNIESVNGSEDDGMSLAKYP